MSARPVSRSIAEVLAEAEASVQRGSSFSARAWRSGFTPLDTHLGGGLRGGELTLVSGPQGQGKTTFVLQMARNVVQDGGSVLYVSYEHPYDDVLARLLAMEAGLLAGTSAFRLTDLRQVLQAEEAAREGLAGRLAAIGDGAEAVAAIASYGGRFHVVGASGEPLSVERLAALVTSADDPPVVFVDYLQKVATGNALRDEVEQVTTVVEALKDLALRAAVPVVAIVAAESAGIASGRVRLHHLRGSSALAYEADVALMLNNKYQSVAKHHLAFSTTNVEKFQEYVVCSIEKNRGGKDRIDLEFRSHFDRGYFDPAGNEVLEQLLNARIVGE